jgi:hypothetical protein
MVPKLHLQCVYNALECIRMHLYCFQGIYNAIYLVQTIMNGAAYLEVR